MSELADIMKRYLPGQIYVAHTPDVLCSAYDAGGVVNLDLERTYIKTRDIIHAYESLYRTVKAKMAQEEKSRRKERAIHIIESSVWFKGRPIT